MRPYVDVKQTESDPSEAIGSQSTTSQWETGLLRTHNAPDLSSYTSKQHAETGDFDEDLDIVNPQAYYCQLEDMEREVIERSELFRREGTYSLRGELFANIADFTVIDIVPARLLLKLQNDRSVHGTEALKMEEKCCRRQLAHLWRSYITTCNCYKLLDQFTSRGFCDGTFSILLKNHGKDVVEIKSIPTRLVHTFKVGFEAAMSQVLEEITIKALWTNFAGCVLPLCEQIWHRLGSCLQSYKTGAKQLTIEGILELLRMRASLLDATVVSYAGSHGSRFDLTYLKKECESIELCGSKNALGFKDCLRNFACLDAFLDTKKVWVFGFHDPGPNIYKMEPNVSSTPLSVLTTIHDLADIWGPVWTIPASAGFIKRYGVSKGVICLVRTRGQCHFSGPIQCHYFSRASFYASQTSNDGSRDEESLLAEDDLLLIGAGLRPNPTCKYRLNDFTNDHVHELRVLGTKPTAWKTDSRGLALRISKIFGVTVSGTQKLIPQTSLKERILNKWTYNWSRANPGVLNN